MPETSTIENRYGSPKKRYGRTSLIVGISLLAGFLGFAIYSNFLAESQASVEVTSYNIVDASHMSANFTAFTGSKAATCVFKAYNANGVVVGYSEVEVPANTTDSQKLQTVVKTVIPAVTIKSDRCIVK